MIRNFSAAVARRVRLLTLLVAATVAGGLGTAAAVGGTAAVRALPAAATATPTPHATPAPHATRAPAATPAPKQPAKAPAVKACPGGLSHGAYVSSVAHAASRGAGKAHGAAVSAAARTDCGKAAGDADSATDERSGPPAKANGKSHATPARSPEASESPGD